MEGGGGERNPKSGPIKLDWGKLLRDDEPPQEVFIQKAPPLKSAVVMAEKDEDELEMDRYHRKLSDKELADKITRVQGIIKMNKLPDGGGKMRANLEKLQAEVERRMRMKVNIF